MKGDERKVKSLCFVEKAPLDRVVICTWLQTSVPVDGDLVNFRARVSDLLGDIRDVTGPENILKHVRLSITDDDLSLSIQLFSFTCQCHLLYLYSTQLCKFFSSYYTKETYNLKCDIITKHLCVL